MGLSAPMADRPHSAFSSTSERTTNRTRCRYKTYMQCRYSNHAAYKTGGFSTQKPNAGGRNWLCFCVRPGNNMVLVYGWKLTCFSVGIEIGLIFVYGAKMTCFRCEDRLTWFLYECSKLTWVSCAGRKWTSFCVGIEIDLVFVWAAKSTWCQCGRSKLTWFQWRDRNWLGFCLGVGNYLVLVSRSKLFCVGASKFIWF